MRPRPDEVRWAQLRIVGGYVRGVIDAPTGRWRLHPDTRLPEGALVADTTRQNTRADGPMLAYVDAGLTCRDCRRPFLFSAKEQRFWYESVAIPTVVRPAACPRCRHLRRKRQWLRTHRAEAMAAMDADHDALRRFVRSSTMLLELGDRVPVDPTVGAARRWRRVAPEAWEPLWYEARLQLVAGRVAAAARALDALGEALGLAWPTPSRVDAEAALDLPEGTPAGSGKVRKAWLRLRAHVDALVQAPSHRGSAG